VDGVTAAITVPVSSSSAGELVAVMVAVAQPVVASKLCGVIASQPDPPNHCSSWPAARPHTVIVSGLNVLPDETSTSRYSLVVPAGALVSGSPFPYSETVTPPSPVPVAVNGRWSPPPSRSDWSTPPSLSWWPCSGAVGRPFRCRRAR